MHITEIFKTLILGTEEVIIIKNNENKVGKVDENDDEDEDEDLFASKDDPFKLFGNKAAPKMV
jgi:hypothetical protein